MFLWSMRNQFALKQIVNWSLCETNAMLSVHLSLRRILICRCDDRDLTLIKKVYFSAIAV